MQSAYDLVERWSWVGKLGKQCEREEKGPRARPNPKSRSSSGAGGGPSFAFAVSPPSIGQSEVHLHAPLQLKLVRPLESEMLHGYLSPTMLLLYMIH
jgi:hypothetical protein